MPEPLLLVLDYPGRRAEARVAELGLESHGFAAEYLLQAPFVRRLRAAEYADELVSRVPAHRPCAAVLAYCMAAPIAQEVAARVGGGADPVPLVLFDGEPSTPVAIEDQYGASAQQFGADLGAVTRIDADPRMFDATALRDRPAEPVELMRRGLVTLGTAALSEGEDDLDAAETALEMAEFYLDWLVHLVAAYNATWPAWGGPTYHVMSRDHRYVRDWPGATETVRIRLDVARAELLRHPDAPRRAGSGRGPNTAGRLCVWPAARPVPAGWSATGFRGTRAECLREADRIGFPPRPPAAGGETLLTLVARTVGRWDERPAVADDSRTLTYRALDRESDAVAAWLRGRGVCRGDRVAVYRRRSASTMAALLGILKAGAAYVAVDPRYPPARRDLMIEAGRVRLVLTEVGWSERLGGLRTDVAELDPDALAAPPRPRTPGPESPAEIGAGDAACVLFTSGSSGVPKAIVLEHGNLCYFADNEAMPALTETDRTAQVSSMSFDAFHFELWGSLAAGAQVVIMPAMSELVAGDLERELQRRRITAMLAPTMAVNHVVHEDRDAFAPLRVLHTGGDVLQPAACRELLAGSFRGEFRNLYGPAEASTACTLFRVNDLADDADTVPIGSPLAGAAVHLLGPDLDPVPDGETGEIHIGGAGVGRQYLDQPGLTADRFLPDPFGPPGVAMYATGDLARRRADGLLEFVGRADDQVKIRGYRVEPREVERLLGRHPDTREVAVLAIGDDHDRRLVALVATHGTVPPARLREFAVAELPDFMVPAHIVTVPAIPGNEHGKRDTDRLTAIALEHLRRQAARVAPTDDMQRYLVGLWEELLAVEGLGVTDDFFALGGNSLLAFRVQRRIRRDLGVELNVREVLGTSELAALAALLHERGREASGEVVVSGH